MGTPRRTRRWWATVAAGLAAVVLAACSTTVSGSATPADALSSAEPSQSQPSTSEPSTTLRGSGESTPSPSSTLPSAPVVDGVDDGSDGTIGRPGIGDPYYPEAGNGGYQVDGYDLALTYDPASNELESTATITGTVVSDDGLDQFNLDLQPSLRVSSVSVNDADATFRQEGAELVISTPETMGSGEPLVAVVEYAGQPRSIPGGTVGRIDGGWFRTESGGAFALGQPFSASAWYPVNDHPADPATFAVTATVPEPWQVISNGVQVTDGLPEPPGGIGIFRWELDEPVASYLTMIYVDQFTVVKDTLADGRPIVSAIGPGVAADRPPPVEETRRVIDELAAMFGPYPYDAAGGVYTGENLGFALETATRPVYGNADIRLLVHELAHQWFGDAVTIERWSDICLNECFASYAEWLWFERVNGEDLDALWKNLMNDSVAIPELWASPLVDMGVGNEFTAVYSRGPVALHALRNEMGDDEFAELLTTWTSVNDGKVVGFDDLTAMASDIAGRDLEPFMNAWFYADAPPPEEFRYPGDLG